MTMPCMAMPGLSTGSLDPALKVNVSDENPIKLNKAAMDRRQKNGDGSMAHPLSNPLEREIQYRLQQPISLHFKNVPLEQAITNLSGLSGIQVVPDYRAMQDNNVNLQAPLSISVDNISMKSALKLMLDQLRLTYIIDNEVLDDHDRRQDEGTHGSRNVSGRGPDRRGAGPSAA